MIQPDLFTAAPPEPRVSRALPPEERARLTANALRVLAYLQTHEEATNVELCRPEVGGLRAIGRVWDLQQAGYPITRRKVRGGIHAYRLEMECSQQD